MEAARSQYLQSASLRQESWWHGSSRSLRPETQKSPWWHFSPDACRLETQAELVFQVESKGRKNPMSPHKCSLAVVSFSLWEGHPYTYWMRPNHIAEVICFTQSTKQFRCSFHSVTPRVCLFDMCLGTLPLYGPVTLTHTIDHHTQWRRSFIQPKQVTMVVL